LSKSFKSLENGRTSLSLYLKGKLSRLQNLFSCSWSICVLCLLSKFLENVICRCAYSATTS
jgi:hypothetical protein